MPNCSAKHQKVINQLCDLLYPYGCGTQCKNIYNRWMETEPEVRKLEQEASEEDESEIDKMSEPLKMYEVECQTLIKVIVEAKDETDAEFKALNEISEMDDLDWGIWATEITK